MSFIQKLFVSDLKKIESDAENPQQRLANIAWPSESMAQLGSYAVGECKRAMFYKVLGMKQTNPVSVAGRHIQQAGIMYEDYHINRFKKHGLHVRDQVRIEFVMPNTTNKVISSGKLDELIKSSGRIRGIEIKSISAYKAPKIMDSGKNLPLPAATNLMQAMLYKFYSETEKGQKDLEMDEMYLMYVNRSDGATFFYKVELDEYGYAILTAIDENGRTLYETSLREQADFDALLSLSTVDKDQFRLAELRISVHDIFQKFDDTYTYARNKMLPPRDYKPIYSTEDLERELHLNRISKVKYNKAKKKGDPIGDSRCLYCSYRKQCLSDSGITMK